MSKKFKDFDAFWEAQERTPVEIKVFGVSHILPPSLPAKLVLAQERIRQERSDTGSVSPSETESFARTLFGSKRVDDWLERDDFSLAMLYDLFIHTIRLYADEAGDGEGEAQTPETGAQTTTPSPTSSSTGASSSPTSSVSTG